VLKLLNSGGRVIKYWTESIHNGAVIKQSNNERHAMCAIKQCARFGRM